MTPQLEAIVMSHQLTPAKQNSILSQCQWTPNGKVRVQCSHHTMGVLQLAGVMHPRPLEYYDVAVKRDRAGFLTVDCETHQDAAAECMGELFRAGGLLAGLADTAPEILDNKQAASEVRGFLEKLRATRDFEIRTGPHSKVIVSLIGYVDESLPSPGEVEQWKPKRPTNTDVFAACHALAMHRCIEAAELNPEG